MPTFCKEERLCSKRHIFLLHKEGQVFYNYPFTIKWLVVADHCDSNIKLLPAVPKRNFKKAVERNRIKRLIREAYRLHKVILLAKAIQHNKNVIITLVFSGKKVANYKEVEFKIVLILQQIADSL